MTLMPVPAVTVKSSSAVGNTPLIVWMRMGTQLSLTGVVHVSPSMETQLEGMAGPEQTKLLIVIVFVD
jgi:hypothetical protein